MFAGTVPVLCLTLAISASPSAPQTEATRLLQFDAASIKPIVPGSQIPGWPDHPNPGGREPGRYTRYHLTLRVLIQIAYQLKPPQILGPAWLDSDHFDLIATVPPTTTDDQVLVMLQNLLTDRFKLKLHREERLEAVYALIVDKHGPKLTAAEPSALPQPVAAGPYGFRMKNASTTDIAGILARWSDRPVVDKTGLTGKYDIDLSWPPDASGPTNSLAALDAIKTLGLTVERRQEPLQYLIVDSGQKLPVEN